MDVLINNARIFINTAIHRQVTGVFRLGALVVLGFDTLFGLNSPDKGARTHVYLASALEVEGVSGRYFEHCREKAMSDLAGDAIPRKRLWEWSEQATGVTFPGTVP
jgi:hypothetical protein